MIYTGKRSFVRTTSGVKDQAARVWGLTDEARGLAGFALGDVGRGVYMTNGRMC